MKTEEECLERQLFGTSNFDYYNKYFSNIRIGDTVFLYNIDSSSLQGPFKAITNCGVNIIPTAWKELKKRGYPYQVRVQSFEFKNRLFSGELNKHINLSQMPPATINDETANRIIEEFKLKNKNHTVSYTEDTVSNYWIFKCDKTTGGKVFSENIMGAPSIFFKDFLNKVQINDIIYVWQIEDRKLYGMWKAIERGRFDEFAFPGTKINTVFKCERVFIFEKGIVELTLKENIHVYFTKNNMPGYKINISEGIRIQEELIKLNSPNNTIEEVNTKPGRFLADDGHWVRSQGELLIDNWLYNNNIIHAYEYRFQRGNVFKKCDFFLPTENLAIEYWGLSGNPEYEISKKNKIQFYRECNIKLLELFPLDLQMLSEVFIAKLSAFGININN